MSFVRHCAMRTVVRCNTTDSYHGEMSGKKTFEQIWTNVNYEMGHQETMKLRSHDIRGLSEWHNKHTHSNEHGEHLLFIVVLFSSIVIDDAHYNCNNRHYTRQIAEQIENIRILSTKKTKIPRLIASWINVFLIRWESIITSRIWRPRLFNEHSNACRREPILHFARSEM